MERIEGGQFGRAWVKMLEDQTISATARLAYVAVTSFGDSCWASQGSIGRRMGVNRDTARRGLFELLEKKWLAMMKDENGAVTWVALNPNPMLEKQAAPARHARSPPARNSRTIIERTTSENISEKKIKPSSPEKTAKGHPEQDLFWQSAKTLFKLKTKSEMSWPILRGFPDRLTRALKTYGQEELFRRWGNYLDTKWLTQKSISHFLTDPDRYTNKPTDGAKPNARAIIQPSDYVPTLGSSIKFPERD